MKVVLQHRSTHLFLSKTDNWTGKPDLAKDFGTALNAMDHAQRCKLEHADIVLKFPDPKYDITLPLMHPGLGPEIRLYR